MKFISSDMLFFIFI